MFYHLKSQEAQQVVPFQTHMNVKKPKLKIYLNLF
jgi:hypothetical protein